MKIDRLIGILSVLLQKDMTTEPELAEKFEVSRRTITRDIDALCNAGIPIQTIPGIGGGIRIMNGYRVDRTILTSREMQTILSGLRSLDSVSGSRYYGLLMEKLKAGSSEYISGNDTMLIDLSSWFKETLAPKIDVIRNAIETRHMIGFRYYAPSGESERTIEPYYLIFHWNNWYVYGWCTDRKDYRLFKLNRIARLSENGQKYVCRNVPLPDLSDEKVFPGGVRFKALFSPDVKWRLIEDYGINSFTETDDGRLLFTTEYTNMENLIAWIMAFGDKAEVIEPAEVRDIIRKKAEGLLEIYIKPKK